MSGNAAGRTAGVAVGRSLGANLFLRTFPVIALIVLVTEVGLAWLIWNDRHEDLEQHAALVTELTADAIAQPLWYLDRTVYEPQVQAMARDPAFRYVRVFDDQGLVLYEVGDRTALQDEGVVSVARDVVELRERRPVGRVEAVFGTDALAHTFQLLALAGTVAFVVLLLGFSAATQLAVRRLILNPLGLLLAAMARVERKDWVTVERRSDDELGQAAAAFNRMVDGLQSGDEAKRLLDELREAQAQLLDRNAAVEEANALILSSIRYARRIQEGVLPDPRALDGVVSECALWWEPLHDVGGDYYWVERKGPVAVVVVADCTGHGVPGAFMTLLVAAALEHLLARAEPAAVDPAALLLDLDRMVRERLRQGAGRDEIVSAASDDGLEAAVCIYDSGSGELRYAGAGIALVAERAGRVERVKADRAVLGYRTLPAPTALRVHRRSVMPGESFYLFTDGVPDQVGSSPKRMFGRRRLMQAIEDSAGLSLAGQIGDIRSRLAAWRGQEPRRDDVALLAFRPVAATGHQEDRSDAGA